MSRLRWACVSIIVSLSLTHLTRGEEVPGVTINHIDASSKVYIGSPGIAADRKSVV